MLRGCCCCSPLTLIQVDTPAIMKATSRQLKEKSVKTKVGAHDTSRQTFLKYLPCLKKLG